MYASIIGSAADFANVPARPQQPLSIPSGESGTVRFTAKHSDESAYDLTNCQVLLTTSTGISRQLTPSDAPNGAGSFPLSPADTVGKTASGLYDVWLTDNDLGTRYQLVFEQPFTITAALGQPNQAVTAPVSQLPLAQGPTGLTGATGATGAQGPKGDKGDPGDGGAAAFSVLYCAAGGQHIDHGPFWKPGQILSAAGCQWEAWFMGDPFNEAGYIVSDGYGGAHALLWSGASGNINFRDGSNADQIVQYSSLSVPPPGVFSHLMVKVLTDAWGNQFIETIINGISTCKTLVPTGYTRAVCQGFQGQGTLFVMGSDHSEAVGWLASLRGWDLEAGYEGAGTLGDVVVPQAVLVPYAPGYGPSSGAPADFCANYVGSPGVTLWPDCGRGYDSNGGFAVRAQHPGAAYGNGTGGRNYYPMPQPIAVPSPTTTAPFYPGYIETPPSRGYTPVAPPAGAKRYDSFSRPDQTYAHVSLPDVGSTESGSLGAAAWQASVIAGGRLFPKQLQLFDRSLRTGDQAATLAYIPNASDSADHTVTVTRISPASGSGNDGTLGVACRVAVDGSSCFYAYYQYIPNTDGTIYLYRMDAANNTVYLDAVGVAHTGWSQLSIKAQGTTISVLKDSTEVISVTDANLAGQKGAGVAFPGVPSSTHYAVTDFAVF